jgi:hypothetical protein
MARDDATDDNFPASTFERSKVFAKTGLKVGKNYAQYLADRVTGRGGDADGPPRARLDRRATDPRGHRRLGEDWTFRDMEI